MKTSKFFITTLLLVISADVFSIAIAEWRKSCYFGGGASEGYRRYAETYIVAKNPFSGLWLVHDGKSHRCCCLQAGTDSYYNAQIWNVIGFDALVWAHAFVNNSRNDAWTWTTNNRIAFKSNAVGDYSHSHISLDHKWEDGILYIKFTGKMGMANVSDYKQKYKITIWTHESEDDSIITPLKINWSGSIELENQNVSILGDLENLTGFNYTLNTIDSTVFEPDTNWIEIGDYSEYDVTIRVEADGEIVEGSQSVITTNTDLDIANFKLYPNPMIGNSDFKIISATSLLNNKVQIYDIQGREVLNKMITQESNVVTINKDFYKKGLFILFIRNKEDEVLFSEKIVVF